MGVLVGNQFKDLREALLKAFVRAQFDIMLTNVGQDRERIATGIDAGYEDIVEKVIGTAEREGWTYTLIRGAYTRNPGSSELTAFIEKYPDLDPRKPPPEVIDHYKTMFLLGNRVLLRRDVLRQQVKNLGVGNNSRVMVVRGPRVSGKTYSLFFINYILEKDPEQKKLTQKPLYFHLDDYAAGPGDLAKRIGMRLGLKPEHMPATKGEQDSRWVPELFDWIMGAIAADPAHVVWLILDGFRVQTLSPEANDFIARFVEEADASPGKLRVVLLNYQLPELLDPYPLKEDIEPITRDHIESFIRHVYENTEKPFTDEQVKNTVDKILTQVDQQLAKKPEEKERWLAYVSAALTKAAQQLSAA